MAKTRRQRATCATEEAGKVKEKGKQKTLAKPLKPSQATQRESLGKGKGKTVSQPPVAMMMGDGAGEPPSCYVVDVEILPGGMRRADRFVFGSYDDLKRWLELEFTFGFTVGLPGAYGEDMILRVFRGNECIYHELFLPRVTIHLNGVPMRFTNAHPRNSDDFTDYRELRLAPITLDGIEWHVNRQCGPCTEYDVLTPVNSSTCYCGNEQWCGKTLFDCSLLYELDCTSPDISYSIRPDPPIPKLPTQGLTIQQCIEGPLHLQANDPAHGIGGGDGGGVSEDGVLWACKGDLRCGWEDRENGEDAVADWGEWPYSQM